MLSKKKGNEAQIMDIDIKKESRIPSLRVYRLSIPGRPSDSIKTFPTLKSEKEEIASERIWYIAARDSAEKSTSLDICI